MTELLEIEVCKNECLSGKRGDRTKKKRYFFCYGRNSYLFLIGLLEACDWLNCKKEIDLSAGDVTDS